MSELTHGSLFSGIGGFELGAKWAGIPTLWNCEIEEFNRKILKQHHAEAKQFGDIRKVANLGYVDIISGGFPCQDISIANVNAIGIRGGRSGLWGEMFRICRDIRPRYIIAENSPMLTIRGLGTVLDDLWQIGYDAEWECLSGEIFGMADKRERIYLVAYPERNRRAFRFYDFFKETVGEISKGASRQALIHSKIKEFERVSDSDDIRISNDIPDRLYRIKALGNAVKPVIAYYFFESIKLHYNN